jgi:thiol-disulfide isomerase/thioredoxin
MPAPARARLLRTAAGLGLAALVLTGCTAQGDDLAQQYGDGTTENYISGTGTVTEVDPADRGEPIEFTGETDSGETLSRSDLDGDVVVLNFWYAGCPPCRAEAPALEEVAEAYADQGVRFVGVNVRDQAETSLAFARTFDVSYPSIIDTDTGSVQLALAGTIAPNSVPTTIVLDGQGRVAARILGGLDGPSILDTLVGDTLAEQA